ncbi:MAG: isoaspartyl peptidase/L-asparaginase [Bacteroidetes bacterium]|nr:isoaspartyl peptidase/L-asparaginase [Bacteroidota bacterium]
MNYGIAIHGGAGTILRSSMTAEKEEQYTHALRTALHIGYAILDKKGSALDAVEAAVRSLEDCPLFNAGKGAVFNSEGKHEMDAAIMDGSDLCAGAVSLVQNVKNPVSLARKIMENTSHVFISGPGAEQYAQAFGLRLETDEYFHDDFRWEQWQKSLLAGKTILDHTDTNDKKFGTVGAVACDALGNLAAATSTGGMTNKHTGRIGDSPMIGAGTYANNKTCAISCTGHGELFIRAVVAHDISALMEYKNLTLSEACEEVVMKKLVAMEGEGGLVAIDKNGNIEMPFNSEGMYRALKSSAGKEVVAIYK